MFWRKYVSKCTKQRRKNNEKGWKIANLRSEEIDETVLTLQKEVNGNTLLSKSTPIIL